MGEPVRHRVSSNRRADGIVGTLPGSIAVADHAAQGNLASDFLAWFPGGARCGQSLRPPLDTCARSQLGLRRFFPHILTSASTPERAHARHPPPGPPTAPLPHVPPRPPSSRDAAGDPMKDCPPRCPSL